MSHRSPSSTRHVFISKPTLESTKTESPHVQPSLCSSPEVPQHICVVFLGFWVFLFGRLVLVDGDGGGGWLLSLTVSWKTSEEN